MSLFPREHGAYGQMAFPLVTSLAVAGVTSPALLIGLAAVAAFLAHEPLLVILGRRGLRAKRTEWHHAIAWLAVSGGTTLGSGIVALWLVPSGVRWSFLLPLLPTLFLAAALSAKVEKSAYGEIAVALAFSLLAIPVCLAAGASTSTAVAVGTTFASVFVTGTLSVRVIVLRTRGGGNLRTVRITRFLLFALVASIAAGLTAAGVRDVLPWTTLLAAAPGLSLAALLVARPPPPTRLRRVGWTLVSTSAAAALILIARLGGTP